MGEQARTLLLEQLKGDVANALGVVKIRDCFL